MLQRVAKPALLLVGLAGLAAWSLWLALGGVAWPWRIALGAVVLAYAACALASYRHPRVAASGAAALTLALAWVTFSDLRAVAGGLAVALGCLAPVSRPRAR